VHSAARPKIRELIAELQLPDLIWRRKVSCTQHINWMPLLGGTAVVFWEKVEVRKLLTHMCTLLSNLSKVSIRWTRGGMGEGEALFKSGLCFLPSFLLCNPSFSRSLSLLSICPGAAFAPPNGFLIPSLDQACSPLQGVLKYSDTSLYNAWWQAQKH